MSFTDILHWNRGSRTEGMSDAWHPHGRPQPVVEDLGLRDLARDLGLPYHDEALRRDAVDHQFFRGDGE